MVCPTRRWHEFSSSGSLQPKRTTAEVQEGTTRTLSRKEFQRALRPPGGPERDAAILDDLETTRKLLRALRLQLICQIARQARSAGLDGIDTSEAFCSSFLGAPIGETESCQETTHLMADPENARQLEAAIRSSGVGETAPITTPSGDASAAS